jgi:hypothetical protein
MRRIPGIVLLSLVGCGAPQADLSETRYKVGSSGYAGLTRKVANDVIKVCYSDPNNAQSHKDDVRYSILEWVDALRDVAPGPLAEDVQLISGSSGCDVRVYIGSYDPARTSMGGTPTVYINHSGWYGSRTVTLHEFGHAFGLLDTYNGRGGSCQTGQPDSVMCRASYNELRSDDIAGIRKMYEMVSQGLMGAEDPLETLVLY